MSTGYRELVGVQATFSKAVPEYYLTHYYQWKKDDERGQVLSMQGYGMLLAEKQEDVQDALRKAYAPATISVWRQVAVSSESQYLQFKVGSSPELLGLKGEWSIVAEW